MIDFLAQMPYSESVEANGYGAVSFPPHVTTDSLLGKVPSRCGLTSRRSPRQRTAAPGGHFAMNCTQCGKEITRRRRYQYKNHFCNKRCMGDYIAAHPEAMPWRSTSKNALTQNPNWGGDDVPLKAGRQRARRWFAHKPCQICGAEKSERHHVDANPLNNTPENIMFLCRRHHMQIDGRLDKIITRNRASKVA